MQKKQKHKATFLSYVKTKKGEKKTRRTLLRAEPEPDILHGNKPRKQGCY